MDWFPPAEASLKRAFIQKLIYELLEHDSQKRLPAACSDEYHCSQSLEKDNDYEHGIEFHLERHSPARACYGYPSCSTADQGIEIKLLTASPGGSQCPRDSELVFRELLEPGSSAESLPDGQFLPHDQLTSIHKFKAVMSPVKEDEESGEQFAFTPSGRAVSSSPTGTSANAYMTSCASKGFTLFDSMKSGISMQQDQQYSDCSSPEASSLGSHSSSEVMVDERLSPRAFVYPNEQKAEELRSASPENVGCITGSPASACSDKLETCIVEDSQEVDRIAENDENNDSLSTCPESFLAPSSHNQTNPGENRNNVGGHMQLSVDDVASEAEEGRATKRIRLMPEVRRRCTRSVTKDGHS